MSFSPTLLKGFGLWRQDAGKSEDIFSLIQVSPMLLIAHSKKFLSGIGEIITGSVAREDSDSDGRE